MTLVQEGNSLSEYETLNIIASAWLMGIESFIFWTEIWKPDDSEVCVWKTKCYQKKGKRERGTQIFSAPYLRYLTWLSRPVTPQSQHAPRRTPCDWSEFMPSADVDKTRAVSGTQFQHGREGWAAEDLNGRDEMMEKEKWKTQENGEERRGCR